MGDEPLLRLPTIHAFAAYRIISDADFLHEIRHLQDMCLWRCTLDQRSLLAALNKCGPLRRLTVVWAGYRLTGGKLSAFTPHISFSKLGDTIRTKHTGPEQLRLDSREVRDRVVQVKTSFGSLVELAKLCELAMSDSALMEGPLDEEDGSVRGEAGSSRLIDNLPVSLRRLLRCYVPYLWVERRRRRLYTGEGYR